jgi:MHS family proline/betaine transporter-like MFS transporter
MSQATAYLDQAIGSADLQRLRRRAIVSCAVGNFVELFDFVIFGLFATQIGANFFPNVDPVLSLLQSFATYGVGFFMRPVGAIVIGALGDLKGRKIALVLTVGLMATATAITGLIPPYASIGIAAPILLVLCRLLQGFSTGGEWGGAAAFLVEYAPPGKRGLIGSMQQFSVGLGLIMGTLSAYLLNTFLDKEAMIAWGWRVPFILGFLLAPIGETASPSTRAPSPRPSACRSSARSATTSSTSSCRASPRASSASRRARPICRRRSPPSS